uniref:FOS like 2, AP-1 transcription factor subunit n=1 Tax=Eptatretus burgeri TaxID=7764 RepID=A0A8C4NE59_EPTBU
MYKTEFGSEYDGACRFHVSSVASPGLSNDSFSSTSSPASFGQEHAAEMARSFVPTLNAITGSHDMQWMVQPSVIQSLVRPHGPHTLHGHFSPGGNPTARPGVIRSACVSSGGRRRLEEQLSPHEDDKRKIRRERNKLAAAKCRNRRKELTDRLEFETSELEEERKNLESIINTLRKEKEHLEFLLAAHHAQCKMPIDNSLPYVTIKQEPMDMGTQSVTASSVSRTTCMPPTRHVPSVAPSSFLFISSNTTAAGSEGLTCAKSFRQSSSSGTEQSAESLSSATLLAL